MNDVRAAWWESLPSDREAAMDAIARRAAALASEVHELQRRRRHGPLPIGAPTIDEELARLTDELSEVSALLAFA